MFVLGEETRYLYGHEGHLFTFLAFREEPAVQESFSSETVDESLPPSQASLISAPPATTVISPKLSEQHMASSSESISHEESTADVTYDDVEVTLTVPPAAEQPAKKFTVIF